MDALTTTASSISKLIPRLASDHDAEVVATARALERKLNAAGMDWHDLAAALDHPPRDPWAEIAKWCHRNGAGRLKTHERAFVRDMATRLNFQPTERQAKWLRDIRDRLEPGAGR